MEYAQPPKNFTHGEIPRPGQRVQRHVHAHARFVRVLAGGLTEIRGEETNRFGSSSLRFRRADEPHAYLVSSSGATWFGISFIREKLPRAEQFVYL
jgi:hypothetical protein